jgi:hypothetical protein
MKLDKHALTDTVNDTFLGLSGTVWCLLAGVCYGIQNIFAKLAYDRGLLVTRFIYIRFLVMFVGSYTFGKLKGINFDLRQYDRKVIAVIFFRSTLSLVSKSC